MHGKKIFLKINLKDAFLQAPVHLKDVPKTTMTTPFGVFQYHYMPFGLSGASQSFQRLIDTVLPNITVTYSYASIADITVFAHIDDILLASNNEEDRLIELKALFTRLTYYGRWINPLKCEFGHSLEFLGHLINGNGVALLPEKVQHWVNIISPRTQKDCTATFGWCGTLSLFRLEICTNINASLWPAGKT